MLTQPLSRCLGLQAKSDAMHKILIYSPILYCFQFAVEWSLLLPTKKELVVQSSIRDTHFWIFTWKLGKPLKVTVNIWFSMRFFEQKFLTNKRLLLFVPSHQNNKVLLFWKVVMSKTRKATISIYGKKLCHCPKMVWFSVQSRYDTVETA